ncbi:MAG: hypothetical protein MUE35_13480 [Hydrogenophaga sp.]|nr:hypothetical protein [Hydrogenophaga sp.]
MARGGYRPGAGRPKGSKSKVAAPVDLAAAQAPADAPDKTDDLTDASPLDYLLSVMRDPKADPVRRDRAAIAAAPFLHPRKEPVGQGKKEAAEAAAKRAATGIFAPQAPPKAVRNVVPWDDLIGRRSS